MTAGLLAPAGAEPVAEPVTVTLPDALAEWTLQPVPAGEYTFADPAREGAVETIGLGPFWVGTTEVTWDLYDVFAFGLDLTDAEIAAGAEAEVRPSMPYGAPDEGFGHQGYAALRMTFHAATQFCAWLTRRTGDWYRLPTEAEWVWLAHLDAAPEADRDAVAWSADNAGGQAQPVGQKAAGRLGLHDLFGNVAEWCVASDGQGVVRGGSWRDPAGSVGPDARQTDSPDWQMSDPQVVKSRWWLTDAPFVGFRILRDPRPAPAPEAAETP